MQPRLFFLAAALLSGSFACRRKHVPVEHLSRLPYPSCEAGSTQGPELLAEGFLRPGPTSLEKFVTERFSLHSRGCLRTVTVRQEWPLAVSDLEVVYDEQWAPLRAWKRMAVPGTRDGHPTIRLYEFRGAEVTRTERSPDGKLNYEIIRGTKPLAIIGPGRGHLTAWLWKHHLEQGQSVREPVLDLREQVEVLRPVTLRREADMQNAVFGRTLRVYTIYGREPFYTDEHDVVVGDMAGLRPDGLAGTPRPPALLQEMPPPDPEHTP